MPSHLAEKKNFNKYGTCKNLKQNQAMLPQLQALTFKSKEQQITLLKSLISLLARFQLIAKLQKIMATRMQCLNCIQRFKKSLCFDEISNKIR